MINLLNLFTGSRKKNDVAEPTTVAPVPAVPRRPAPPLWRSGSTCLPTTCVWWRGAWRTGCVSTAAAAGSGKTRVVLATLRDEGIDSLVLTGHVTPLSLYMNLYEHQDAVVFGDESTACSGYLPALGILEAALWGENDEKRLVTYNSSQLKIPSSFHFSGRVILASTRCPSRNNAFDAVLSRVDQFELSASNEEVLEMMRRLAAQGFEEKLTADECMEVVDFVAEFSATRELSLRLLEPSLRKVLYARDEGVDWRQLVASQLHEIGKTAAPKVSDSRSYDLECLKQVLDDHPDSIAEQENAWRMLDSPFQSHVLPTKEEPGHGRRAGRHGTSGDGNDRLSCKTCQGIYPASRRSDRDEDLRHAGEVLGRHETVAGFRTGGRLLPLHLRAAVAPGTRRTG